MKKFDSQRLEELLQAFEATNFMAFKSVAMNQERNPELFLELGSRMATWAEKQLGEDWIKVLCDGYKFFTVNANRHQSLYERDGKYIHSDYQSVHDATYGSPEFMNLYHWGVYLTTFFWEHHLHIYEFYRDRFLPLLGDRGTILELGSGSGIWGMLALEYCPDWSIIGIDISETSVCQANELVEHTHSKGRAKYETADALTYNPATPADACVSCFLAEHLENPLDLFRNINCALKERGYAFATVALTAAEVDHIYEFRNESEPIRLAEEAGLRVISTFSSSPAGFPQDRKFLPRSMAMIMQKKKNEIW